MDVEDLLDAFKTVFLADDGPGLAELYDTPYTHFRARQNFVHTDRSSFVADAQAIRGAYARLGLARMEYEIHNVQTFDPGLTLATVEWIYYTSDNTEIVRHDCTMGIRDHNGTLRFAFHIAHNEYVRRPAFISPADRGGSEDLI